MNLSDSHLARTRVPGISTTSRSSQLRDRTKENEFSFAWITSYNNRATKMTGNDFMSGCVTAIFPIPN
jgi:hypothetical protein